MAELRLPPGCARQAHALGNVVLGRSARSLCGRWPGGGDYNSRQPPRLRGRWEPCVAGGRRGTLLCDAVAVGGFLGVLVGSVVPHPDLAVGAGLALPRCRWVRTSRGVITCGQGLGRGRGWRGAAAAGLQGARVVAAAPPGAGCSSVELSSLGCE